MKPETKYAALAAAMLCVWGTASAQSPASSDPADEFSRSLTYENYLKGKDLRASQVVGSRVRNAGGENLGEIEELVIPTRDQDDMLVILSVGGVFDLGDKLVALPYDNLRVSPDGDTFYFDRTEAELKAAPAFTYGAEGEVQTRVERRDTPRASAAKSANVLLDAFDHRASDLIGATVLDDRGESVGKVDDIVVSTEDDELHAVLAIGGFVGFGAKLITMPLDDMLITSDGDDPQVRIAMTNEQLQQLLASRSEFRYERQVAQAPAKAPRG